MPGPSKVCLLEWRLLSCEAVEHLTSPLSSLLSNSEDPGLTKSEATKLCLLQVELVDP